MTIKTFSPNCLLTATLAASAASSNTAIDQFSSVVRVQNKGPNEVFIQFGGNSGVTATTSHMPVAAGATETFGKAAYTHVAAICNAGETATVRFTSGEGL